MKAKTLAWLLTGSLLLLIHAQALAQTIAYYRFEESTPGTKVPVTPDALAPAGSPVLDYSGHGNNLKAFADFSAPTYSANVPAAFIPRSGAGLTAERSTITPFPPLPLRLRSNSTVLTGSKPLLDGIGPGPRWACFTCASGAASEPATQTPTPSTSLSSPTTTPPSISGAREQAPTTRSARSLRVSGIMSWPKATVRG